MESKQSPLSSKVPYWNTFIMSETSQKQTFTLKNPKTGKVKVLKNMEGWFAHQMRREYYPDYVFVKPEATAV